MDAAGVAVDGDGDGMAGGDAVESVFRLYGDGDREADVDAIDRAAFRAARGRVPGSSGYLPVFDYESDGRIDLQAPRQSRRRLSMYL